MHCAAPWLKTLDAVMSQCRFSLRIDTLEMLKSGDLSRRETHG